MSTNHSSPGQLAEVELDQALVPEQQLVEAPRVLHLRPQSLLLLLLGLVRVVAGGLAQTQASAIIDNSKQCFSL